MDAEGGFIPHYEPSYRMKPYDEKKFQPAIIKKICDEAIQSVLAGKAWNGEEETVWTVSISETIKQKVKELDLPRYKIIVQVFLGENRAQGTRIASRCLWDADTDNYASSNFKNDTLWCVAMVFGTYTE